jgi:hypothetical protein
MQGAAPQQSLPEIRYRVPPLAHVRLQERDGGLPWTAVELEALDGSGTVTLIEQLRPRATAPDGSGAVFELLPAIDREYTADLVLESPDERERLELRVNSPVAFAGWRLYLMSYDQSAFEYVVLRARRDPGRGLAVGGLYAVLLGVAWTCYGQRPRPLEAAAGHGNADGGEA